MFKIELDLIEKPTCQQIEKVDPHKISTAEEAVSFSTRIVNLLKEKVKWHNAQKGQRISLAQLKGIFLRASSSASETQTQGFLGLARVNMYLRIVAAQKIDKIDLLKSKTLNLSKEIDFSDAWNISEADVKLTQSEVEKFNLNKNFDLDELYLQDEEQLTFGEKLKDLL